ncbi:MAG TPA: hypothetical protein DCO79_08780 [Spirochaeta sp.]|nr:hypothetical protein [Spirochaeta sp.]
MKKLIIIMTILIIAIPLFADNAVLKEAKGRVEIQTPGGRWQSAAVGDLLPSGASISTGFGSSAVIDAGASTITVEALTRMKLEELIEAQGAQTTGLFLRVGKVKAEVKRDTGLSHDFKLRSPSSTAAVRGTSFSYDGSSVTVDRGVVALFGASIAREVLVAEGERSKLDGNGTPGNPLNERYHGSGTEGDVGKKQDSSSQSGASLTAGFGGGTNGSQKFKLYGDITITVE